MDPVYVRVFIIAAYVRASYGIHCSHISKSMSPMNASFTEAKDSKLRYNVRWFPPSDKACEQDEVCEIIGMLYTVPNNASSTNHDEDDDDTTVLLKIWISGCVSKSHITRSVISDQCDLNSNGHRVMTCYCSVDQCNLRNVTIQKDLKSILEEEMTSSNAMLTGITEKAKGGNMTKAYGLGWLCLCMICGVMFTTIIIIMRRNRQETGGDYAQVAHNYHHTGDKPIPDNGGVTFRKRLAWAASMTEKQGTKFSQCSPLEVVGQGSSSVVWTVEKLTHVNPMLNNIREDQIVVKTFDNPVNMYFYENELNCYRQLSKYKWHPNILRFFGPSFTMHPNSQPSPGILLQRCPGGSMCNYLLQNRVNQSQLRCFYLDLSAALSFLHGNCTTNTMANVYECPRKLSSADTIVFHRDMKSDNVLIRPANTLDDKYGGSGDRLVACLSDFGLSFVTVSGDHEQYERQVQIGTWRYMSPEMLRGVVSLTSEGFKSADVYSLGLVLWEILSRCSDLPDTSRYQLPFADRVNKGSKDEIYQAVVVNEYRPPISLDWHNVSKFFDNCLETIRFCWDSDPECRISASCVYSRMF